MIPRKPNLLITQLSDKRLPCPANRSSRAGKVEGSRKIPSKRRLSLVLGKPLFSALIGATKQWIIPSGTNSGGKDREMCSSPVFCLIALNHKPRELCLHTLGSKCREGIQLQSKGIWLYFAWALHSLAFAVCLLQVEDMRDRLKLFPQPAQGLGHGPGAQTCV